MYKLAGSSKEQHNDDFDRLKELVNELPEERRHKLKEYLEEKEEEMKMQPLFLSVHDFSKLTGIPEIRLRRWLREGRIKGKKVSRTWLIHRDEIKRLKED